MATNAWRGAPSGSVGAALVSRPREISQVVGKSFPQRVLIVDHEPLIRWSLAEILTEAGHSVTLAEDQLAAREAVTADVPFDVVFLDGDLPGSCDFSLLSGLRLLAPRARIIFMTAFGSPSLVRGALNLGAFRVLEKPFDVTDLPALVA